MTNDKTGNWVAGRPDFALIALVIVLTLTGLVVVYSASFVKGLTDYGDGNYFIIRQLAWAMIGTILFVAGMRFNYQLLRPLAVPIILLTLLLLVAVLAVGLRVNGAQRWIGVGAFTLQPAEFAKLSVIVYLAAWLEGRGDSLRSLQQGLLPFGLMLGMVGVLIMLQPSFGTTAIIVLITVTMFYVGGASYTQMGTLLVTGIVAGAILALGAGYRADRVTGFFNHADDPAGTSFQVTQSVIAIGNGGIDGLGLGASRAKFFYIPESHTDGVFAILSEELGLIAGLSIMFLFILFTLRGYQVARRSRDQFGMLIATGVTTWVIGQALLNIGGISRTIPLTGVPLPFLSFGGNALAAVMMASGVLINVSRYQTDKGGYLQRRGAATAAASHRIIRRRRSHA